MSVFKYAALLTGLMVCFLGCEQTFVPVIETDLHLYSMFGALDANADTQVVRVMKVRGTVAYQPEPIDARVTLEELETGVISVMTDSLFQFTDRSGQQAYAWNFLSDMAIKPGNHYRLTATRTDGQFARAEVQIPNEFPEPDIRYICEGSPAVLSTIALTMTGIERLPVANVTYKYRIRTVLPGQGAVLSNKLYEITLPQLQNRRLGPETNSIKRVTIFIEVDYDQIVDRTIVESRSELVIEQVDATIVSAGPEWPSQDLTQAEAALQSGLLSNIENGVGSLAGMVSKTIPINFNYPC